MDACDLNYFLSHFKWKEKNMYHIHVFGGIDQVSGHKIKM